MKKTLLLSLLLMVVFASRSFGQNYDSTTLGGSAITSNVTLTNDKIYIMKGFNYVRNGAIVAIQKGTLILGDKETTGTLIIERGSKLVADGTREQPIVFTSRKPAGQRAPGDWGGIILLGRSSINTSSGLDSAQIEGFPPGTGPWYGGQPVINDDNSGILRHVRLEYPGVNLTGKTGNEINGLTMGGVGSNTILEYVQISYSGDDAFEWFGGNVNGKYLIAVGTIDDDFDCDNGFRGKVQFGLAIRDSARYDVSASHFFEVDNNNQSTANYNSPRTNPVFSNITCIGPNVFDNPLFLRGVHIRRNTWFRLYNSILTAYRTGVRFDGTGVYNASQGDTIQFRNNIFAGFQRLADTAGSTTFSGTAWLQTSSFANRVYTANSNVMLTNFFGFYGIPQGPNPVNNINFYVPQAGSPALSGADFSNPNLAGFEVTTYVGAFGSNNDWISGWSNFNMQWYTPSPIGISHIGSTVPDKYILSQNYPNPFNPSTKINFSIPKSGFVTLKVFDATGRQITELVNQSLVAGEYEYQFDASKLTTGVYFYTLRSDNFSETKKMLLVK